MQRDPGPEVDVSTFGTLVIARGEIQLFGIAEAADRDWGVVAFYPLSQCYNGPYRH